jgi:hypothetical protein
MSSQKETYIINEPTREANNLLEKTPFVTAIIVPEKNEFRIEPYEVYQNYHGDATKAKRMLNYRLRRSGFLLLRKNVAYWRTLGDA